MQNVFEKCVCGVCPSRVSPTRCSLCKRPHCLGHEMSASARSLCESCVRGMKTVVKMAVDRRIAAELAEIDAGVSGRETRAQSQNLRPKRDAVNAPKHQLEVVRKCMSDIVGFHFTDGRDDDGKWIDCVSKMPIPTCNICFAPSLQFDCNPFWTASGTAKCSMTGLDDAKLKELCDEI